MDTAMSCHDVYTDHAKKSRTHTKFLVPQNFTVVLPFLAAVIY